MTLAAYCDDSFISGGPVYALGAYVGDLDMFDHVLAPLWSGIIKNAPHQIPEFKTSDCRQGTGKFRATHGWTQAERSELTKQIVGVLADKIGRGRIFGYGSAMAFPFTWTGDRAQEMERHGFFPCLLDILQVIAFYARYLLEDGEHVRLIFDDKPKYKTLSAHYFQKAMAILPPEFASRFELPTFENSESVEGLQAADLIAYETMKEVKSRIQEPDRPVSKALLRLAAAHEHSARCSSYWQLVEVDRLRKLGREPKSSDTYLKPKRLYCSWEPWRHHEHWSARDLIYDPSAHSDDDGE